VIKHYSQLLKLLIAMIASKMTSFAATNDTLLADYSPFLNGKPWPRFPILEYAERASNVWVHPNSPSRFASVKEVHDANADFTTVVIEFPDGKRFKTYNEFVLGPFLSAVYSGDFNGDGKPDFVAVKPGSGCGLAGEYCTGVFAFSNDDDYSFRRISTMGLGPHDLVVDPGTKTFRLIHTSFRSAASADGNYHSFWVHRLYEWQARRFERDLSIPTIWIQYLYRANHEPTKLLTPLLKAKAWADDPEADARIDW
jgi:hypothetical protein